VCLISFLSGGLRVVKFRIHTDINWGTIPIVMKTISSAWIGVTMNDKVYILLDVIEWQTEKVVERLRSIAGVRNVDPIEGNPNVIALLEAPDRQRLAEITMKVISSEENIIQDLKLLPVCNETESHSTSEASYTGS
jgi:DNA-binding Lrp family transcriptional regulator